MTIFTRGNTLLPLSQLYPSSPAFKRALFAKITIAAGKSAAHRCRGGGVNAWNRIAVNVNHGYDGCVKVTITATAQHEFAMLPRVIQARVLALFERLAQWPTVSGAKPLTGKLAGRYRIRTGDYRVLFRVHGDAVIVEKIGHRDRFYEG
jgi:mRNA interferase RelE/StbE